MKNSKKRPWAGTQGNDDVEMAAILLTVNLIITHHRPKRKLGGGSDD